MKLKKYKPTYDYDIHAVQFFRKNVDALIKQELELVDTGHIPLPEMDFKLEIGDRLEFKADFYGEYVSYETDCGTEHDAYFEFQKVTDLWVWRVIHEVP